MVARLLFEKLGYKPDFVENGKEALEAVESRIYDVVFMDVQMPVMDGLTATRELCSRQVKGQRPRIVGMSANVMLEDRQAGELAGMEDYVVKPVTPAELTRALKLCVRRK
jgi:CheY-like chemotaxis protein